MKKICFTVENDGFYGSYYECSQQSDHVMIGLFGDDPNDYMAKCGAKWLCRQGINVMAMSPGTKDYSHVNCPIERVEKAIEKCKSRGNSYFGIMGMSTAGKYVRRMKRRLEEKPHICKYKAITYEYGTHFVLPESMLRIALPVGLRLFMRLMFRSAKEHPKECEQTRKDIDREIRKAIKIWKRCL